MLTVLRPDSAVTECPVTIVKEVYDRTYECAETSTILGFYRNVRSTEPSIGRASVTFAHASHTRPSGHRDVA